MELGFYKDKDNSWTAPLPFKTPRRHQPNNKVQALNRFRSLQRSFNRKPELKEHFFAFMQKIFQNGHAEEAPLLEPEEECWYLPIFGVYHPKKPGQIRAVFDSSAKHNGVSLNDVLLTGPDLNNNLLGVLLRFRQDSIAITADIQQMFHCFLVRPDHRNFLRFLWYQDNDFNKDIKEYRMRVHVFGNSPSPAVAIFGLRKTAQEGEETFGRDVKRFVERNFYVDDALKSLPSASAAIDLLKRAQQMLACSNLRLHKIASNNAEVMAAFPSDDHASNLKDLDPEAGDLPMQRSLGVSWDLKNDTFTFQVSDEHKPFTRRGVLSTINSLYDPLGFVAPILLQGKAILRELTVDCHDWDAPLPAEKEQLWTAWRGSLQELRNLQIPRSYTQVSPSTAQRRELCIFSDASVKSVAAVAYLRLFDQDGSCHVSFVLGKAKLAPRPELTIPRLELCAAVLAVDIAEFITAELDIQLDDISYFTDSKVVLGYIYNEKRRFYVFVNNRVQRIRRFSSPTQWHFVSTDNNPADHATRFISAARLKDTMWLTGPAFLSQPQQMHIRQGTFDLVNPEQDVDVRLLVSTLSTTVRERLLGSQRFCRFSSWKSLTRAISCLTHIVHLYKKNTEGSRDGCNGWHHCAQGHTVEMLTKAQNTIIRTVQEETYAKELQCIRDQTSLPQDSLIRALSPFIDTDGLIRVGGRITEASLGYEEKQPIIVPGRHHIATLLVRYYHEQTQHQGRLFTEGAIRSAGLWIVGGKRCVNSLIFRCVTCRRLRRTCETQKMADLPDCRLNMDPPFSYVGLDVFGPWSVSSRRTRGGQADSKRWAVLFCCLSIRAIHIEIIESMDTSSFINALRRFIAIRGPVKQLRSDRGTNFVGACHELLIPSNINKKVERFLTDQGCMWEFNPPHASHMGGAWERMIGLTRKILDSMFLQLGSSRITHEVLVTLMAEVTAIVNSRPLVPVSTDPDDPFILTPATLLTQKTGPSLAPPGDFDGKDLYRRQWRQVQSLANTFWDKWRKQYLSTLQTRRKWQSDKPNLTKGSLVLIKVNQAKRNTWPIGRITEVFPSKDGRVRKVEVKVALPDGVKVYLRPVTELVLLLPSDD
nr:uncharacterized protein LOC129414995 [Misgurnus anguillicaudatus]